VSKLKKKLNSDTYNQTGQTSRPIGHGLAITGIVKGLEDTGRQWEMLTATMFFR
jgi:hypothetical protein